VLIHSAGVISGEIRACVQELDWQYRANVRAPSVDTSLAAYAHLVRVKSCSLTQAQACAKASVGQYAKLSMHKAIADSLREEVNADGLRVLSVFPGRTSPMQAAVHERRGISP